MMHRNESMHWGVISCLGWLAVCTLATLSKSQQPSPSNWKGTYVVPHQIASQMRYRREPRHDLGARVQAFVLGKHGTPKFEGKTAQEWIDQKGWAWSNFQVLADSEPEALQVWEWNTRGAPFLVGDEILVQADGLPTQALLLGPSKTRISSVAFFSDDNRLRLQRAVIHLVHDAEATLAVQQVRFWTPLPGKHWSLLYAQSAIDSKLSIERGSRAVLELKGLDLPRAFMAIEVLTDRGSLWCGLKGRPEQFDISGGWIGENLGDPEYRKLLASMHVNTGQIQDIDAKHQPDAWFSETPFKSFNRMMPLEQYDKDEWLPRIHAVEFLGEPQYGGGRPVPPQEVFDAFVPYLASRLPTSVTHSEERVWRDYAGLSDYPHFDAYRVVAPAADSWRQYDRWGGRRISWGAPLETISVLTRSLRDLSRPVSIAAWSQGPHDGWGGFLDGRRRRSPTPAELRSQALHALASRITSLYWFNLSRKSLLKFPDTWDAMRRIGREIQMMAPTLLDGDAAYYQQLLDAQGRPEWDVSTIVSIQEMLIFALDLNYQISEENTFEFGDPRELQIDVPWTDAKHPPVDLFRWNADGIQEVEWRYENERIIIVDRGTEDCLYVASKQPTSRSSWETRRQEALAKENRFLPEALSPESSP
ncbi:MAG: hypothetical protein ACK44Z_17160 [Pirellulaceae bacterium]